MCTGAEIAALAVSAAGTGATSVANNDALRRKDRDTAAGILRQADLSRQANAKVSKNIQQLEQSNPNEDITKRQAVYLDALRRAQPAANQSLPVAAGGSQRFAEDVSNAQGATAGEAATSANLMARIDAPGIQRTREGQMAGDTLSQLSMLDDQSKHDAFLTQLRASMERPNQLLMGAGALAKGYGSARAVNGALDGSVWDDDTTSSGLTANQRRQRYVGGF